MLRVNLLEDPTFRKDLLDMARGLLRGIAESIIAETIAKEGWLQQRLDNYLTKNPIEDLVATALRKGDYWNRPPVQAAIDKRVDDRIRRHLDSDHKLSEQDLRHLIREEINMSSIQARRCARNHSRCG